MTLRRFDRALPGMLFGEYRPDQDDEVTIPAWKVCGEDSPGAKQYGPGGFARETGHSMEEAQLGSDFGSGVYITVACGPDNKDWWVLTCDEIAPVRFAEAD